MPRTSLVALALALGALSVLPSEALEAHLVADINPQFFSEGSNPGPFVSLGGRVVFQVRGSGLWTSNGTEEETQRLGPQDLNVISDPVGAGPLAYFVGCREKCGVWRTDGTTQGTFPLVELEFLSSSRIEAIAPAGSPWTYFVVDKGFLSSVWRTNGTPQGTRLLFDRASRARELTYFQGRLYFFADVNGTLGLLYSSGNQPGSAVRVGTSVGGRGLVAMGGRLYYFSQASTSEFWTSNGTSAGTRRLATLGEPNSPIVVAANRAFFFDREGDALRLWVSDGTATGSKVLRSFESDGEILALGPRVAFSAAESTTGRELWTSDGTALGTRRVRDICPGPCSGVVRLGLSAKGRIWFQGSTIARGTEIWTSDLTAAGTRLVKDLCRGGCSSSPEGWIESGNLVFFSANRADGRSRVARSDGTPTGTFWITEGGQFSSLSGVPFGGPGSLFFAGSDSLHGVEPWRSDGTIAGTHLVADLRADNQIGSRPRGFASAGGLGFFFAGEDEHGIELWASDGTAAGTRLAYDQRPGSGTPNRPNLPLSSAGGRLILFSESDNNFQGFGLIASDGSPAGSGPLLPAGVIADGRHRRVGDRFYFVAFDGVHGSELWVTDGTVAGTLRLTDLVPPEPFRPASSSPIFLGLGDRLIAPVLSPAGGEELWISDGSIGGTRRLEEVYPFLEESLARTGDDILSRGGFFYYVSTAAGADSATLWRTDLTAGGTAPVADLDLSEPTIREWSLFEVGGKILILGFTNAFGQAVWVSDGTAAGTRIVGPFEWFSGSVPVVFAGRLWASDLFGETWVTDGTVSGTSVFRDNTGSTVRARELGVLGDRLIFVGERSLTESDGTPEGTVAIELDGGRIPDFVDALFLGDKALFNGSDPLHGEELWILTPQ